MQIIITPHSLVRMAQRGITDSEVRQTVRIGYRTPARGNRIDFIQDFIFNSNWHGNDYKTKRVIATVEINDNIYKVITVKSKYF